VSTLSLKISAVFFAEMNPKKIIEATNSRDVEIFVGLHKKWISQTPGLAEDLKILAAVITPKEIDVIGRIYNFSKGRISFAFTNN